MDSQAFDEQSASVIKLNNNTVLFLKEVANQWIDNNNELQCFARQPLGFQVTSTALQANLSGPDITRLSG